MASNDVCEHQNANYLRMMSERDDLRVEVEGLRDALVSTLSAAADRIEAEERKRDEAQRQVADLRAGIEALADTKPGATGRALRDLLAGSGEQPGKGERAWLNADPRKAAENIRAVVGAGEQPGECPECGDAMCRCGIDWTAPVVPDSADVRERVWQALRESRRNGLGGMTEAQALDHMTDAVLAAVRPSGQEGP